MESAPCPNAQITTHHLAFHPPMVHKVALSVEQLVAVNTLTPYTTTQIAACHLAFHPHVFQKMVLSGIIATCLRDWTNLRTKSLALEPECMGDDCKHMYLDWCPQQIPIPASIVSAHITEKCF